MLTIEEVRQVTSKFPIQSNEQTVDDDGFFIVSPNLQSGLIFITVVNSSASFQGIFAYDVDSPTCVLATIAANLEATTGVLDGTTGTDGKITVSASDKLYIENRSGESRNIHWLTIF